MIEILEKGPQKFTAKCHHCGCLFSYELEDLTTGEQVKCPQCSSFCTHEVDKPIYVKNVGFDSNWIDRALPTNLPIQPVQPITINEWPPKDCKDCPYYETLDGSVVYPTVGDTPCTWCRKNISTC